MPSRLRPLMALLALLVVGCQGVAGSPGPSPSASPPEAEVPGYRLRATLQPVVPPEERFGLMPVSIITDEGVWVTQGAVIAIFPGPLVPPLFGREVSEAGYGAIVERARELGLLAGEGDFVPDDRAPDEALGRIELWVDGEMRELRGDPGRVIQCITTPCDPAPGTPEAFATFWQFVSDLSGSIGQALGPERPYEPDGYALLLTAPVTGEPGMQPRLAAWPLETALAEVGTPIGDAPLPRCATITGEEAAALGSSLAAADQLTNWADPDPASDEEPVALRVRPIIAGEDPCADLQVAR